MATKTLTHAASLGALIAFMALTPILPAPAADGPQKASVAADGPQKASVKVAAGEGTSPITDPVASAWYRNEVLPVHLGRLLLA